MERHFDEPAVTPSAENQTESGMVPSFDESATDDGRFLAFAAAAADAIVVIDSHSRIVFINRAAEKIFNYAADEMLGQPLTLLMPDYLRHAHRAGLERYISTGVKHIPWSGVELPGRRRGGQEIPLEISFGEFTRHGQKFFTGIARDITSRKRAEEAQQFIIAAGELLAASPDYEQILQEVARLGVPSLADWVLVDLIDEEGWIKPIAVAHEDAAQLEVALELARRFAAARLMSAATVRALRTEQARLYEEVTEELLEELASSGELLERAKPLGWQSVIITPLRARGRTLGVLTFAMSASGRRYHQADLAQVEDLARRVALAVDNARLYREAHQSNRLKDEFLATLSHELRTPLTAILGWTGLLRSVGFDAEHSARALETIERNAHSQKQLIDDLLDASRIITGHLRIDVRPTSLAPVIEAALEAALPLAAAKRIALSTTLDPGIGLISGDPGRLRQIVDNLLSNAIKFTPSGREIEIRLEGTDEHARLSVRDTGEGISPEFLPFVFDRFRQADGSTTRQHGGLGLGLAIVRHLAELHGGTVAATSDGVGQGATFAVMLPLLKPTAAESQNGVAPGAGPEATARAEARQLPRALAGLRVLVVEDDEDTLVLLGRVLERQGASVTLCDSAKSARAAFADGTFDLLISDIGLPGEDGYTLLKKIRELGEGGRLPALALTAYAMEDDRRRAFAAGFQRHLPKPISPDELIEAAADLSNRRIATR